MSVPLQPGREQARRWAEHELSDPQYRDSDLSLLEKLGRAISHFFDSLVNQAAEMSSAWTLLIIAAVIAIIVGLLIWRLRRGSSGGMDLAAFDSAGRAERIDPEVFWTEAHRAAAAGDFTVAVQNGVRGIFARLAAAELIDITAASTASELAASAGRSCPPISADAQAVGALFDAVTFGEAHATDADWQGLLTRADRIATGSAAAVARHHATASGAGDHGIDPEARAATTSGAGVPG